MENYDGLKISEQCIVPQLALFFYLEVDFMMHPALYVCT